MHASIDVHNRDRCRTPGRQPGYALVLLAMIALAVGGPAAGAQEIARQDSIAAALAKRVSDKRHTLDTLPAGAPDVQRAEAHNALGLAHWASAQYDSALVHLRLGQQHWTAAGDSTGMARAFNNLGVTYYQWGQYEPALDGFRRSLELRRRLGDKRGLALVLSNLGNTYRDLRLYDRARPLLEEAVSVARQLGEPAPLGYALHNLGLLHMDLGGYDEAIRLLESSTVEYQRLEDEPRRDAESGWALNQVYLGLVHSLRGDTELGVQVLEDVRALAERQRVIRREAMALLHLGRAYRAQGDLASSLRALQRARALSDETGQRALSLTALEELAEVHRSRGETSLALDRLRAYHALRDSVFSQNTVQRIAAAEAQGEADRRAAENARLRSEQVQQDAVIGRQRLVVILAAALLIVAAALVGLLVRFNRLLGGTNAQLAARNDELTAALSEVRTLEGLIPICASCKKVRDDDGFWGAVETYISSRSQARFSHGICSECGPRLYGKDWPVQPVAGKGTTSQG